MVIIIVACFSYDEILTKIERKCVCQKTISRVTTISEFLSDIDNYLMKQNEKKNFIFQSHSDVQFINA